MNNRQTYRATTIPCAPGTIIFSLEDGIVWASWDGAEIRIPLGPQHEVEAMMLDFLAQSEIAKRLNNPKA